MTRLEIILSAVLAFSVLLNIGLIYYVRGAIVRLLSISEELGDLQTMIDSFAKHVKAVSFNEQLETFEYIYSLTEDETELQGTQIDDEDDDAEDTEDEET